MKVPEEFATLISWILRSRRRAATAAVLALCAVLGPACPGSNPVISPFTIYWAMTVADLDGDGRPDLIYTQTHVGSLHVEYKTLEVALQDPAHPGQFLPPLAYSTGLDLSVRGDPTSIALADLDGDGHLDVIVGNSADHTISIFLQDPAMPGHLKSPSLISVRSYVNGVAAADLDGDGKADIVVAEGIGVSVFLQGAAPGTFLPPVTLDPGEGTSGVVIGDLDGDSIPDIAATAGGLVVFRQDPANRGSFLPAVTYPAGIQPSGLVLRDLNGDGLPDLAVVNEGPGDGSSHGSVSVHLQDPLHPGQFLAASFYGTGYDSFCIAVGDLNGDGEMDLAVGNNLGESTVSLVTQNPAAPGHFLTPPTIALPKDAGTWSIAIADLNQDGFPDLVVCGGGLGVVALFQDPANPGQFGTGVVVGQ